jgi:transcriptional regulator with XRE-family HTH domain
MKTAHPFLKRLGETIRLLRLKNGHSQETLSELAGIDRSYMSGIERGLRNLSVLHAIRLSRALKIPLHELLRQSAAPFGLENSHFRARDGHDVQETAYAFRHQLHLAPPPSREIAEEGPASAGRLADWKVGQSLSLG